MKSKIFSLVILSILSLVVLFPGVIATSSGVFTITDLNVPSQVSEDSDSFTFTFNLTYTGSSESTAISFADSTTSIGTLYIPAALDMDGSIEESKIITGTLSNFKNHGGEFINVIINATTGTSRDDETTFSVFLTSVPKPQEIEDCLAIGDSGNIMELEIEDINIITGFGEDNEWVPRDTVEIEVRVENRDRDFDLEDIELRWGLYNLDIQEWIIDEEESDFDLKDGEEETIIFDFKLEEPDEFDENGNYIFYVWANAIGEEFDNPVCRTLSEDIDMIIEKDFLILDDFEIEGISVEDEMYSETLSCGSRVQITAKLWNIGYSDQEDIELRIYNSDFEIDELLEIGDVDAFDYELISFEFTIPEAMDEEIWHALEFTIKEDGDIFENDYTDDDAEFEVLFKLENCAVPQAFVGAALDSEAKAGRELVVRTTITNTGTETTNYLVNAFGYSEWASSVNIEPKTITLQPGQSADVLITLDVNRDVSGERLFNIEVLSEGELVMSQPLSVNIEKALLGDIFGDNGLITALIIGIAVILVIIIIVLAIRLARK